MSQRIKGQEVSVLLIVDGEVMDTITDVRSFSVTLLIDTLSEGYLGETTERQDEIFKGVEGDISFHFENQDVFNLFAKIVDRAQRRTPGVRVNIKATMNFPNGDSPMWIIYDVAFGNLATKFGSRADYGEITLPFKAATFQVVTA